MLSRFLGIAQTFSGRLTRLDNQPVGKAALTVILFLDLFVLVSIFNGLADHTAQLTSPLEHIPYGCRNIVIDEKWNETTRLEKLARIAARHQRSYYAPEDKNTREDQHVLCTPLLEALANIKNDKGLARDLAHLLDIREETQQIQRDRERLKGAYDTSLLETIAKQPGAKANVSDIRNELSDKTKALNELTRKHALLAGSLNGNTRVLILFSRISALTDQDRTRLRDDLRRQNFLYPVKRLGMEMIFLLPLFLVFWFWNSKSITRQRPFQSLVSSHLLVVAVIPAFFKLIQLIYDIIPHKLLKNLIALLESLNLVALWHYSLIVGGIVAALALTYLFQKKLFSRDKLVRKRISRGLCQDCGQRLPANSRYCPACGFAQYRHCGHCQQLTHVFGKYCVQCGKA